ncbi:hypothetical protein [Amycolatopsis regifaucium]|uniref:Uncharacterized protein n=1 Tax=Amycolatopsis regifaucium TaxID=546365 RepID=A0A154MBU5_9PSEU|nr:hypothetical protein [Amycolatopsis regifaucium]KZB81986.1 hypothetical protein AVL48_08495 [Amycolatopsis regifaucium]OKA05941.1 hypothetical protein ATP06_0222495 [Amycolatopsis regifaucium]SFG78748.1 hypothetical protein SAMN04489731_101478 [Amycolatopsis regifaucium]
MIGVVAAVVFTIVGIGRLSQGTGTSDWWDAGRTVILTFGLAGVDAAPTSPEIGGIARCAM